MTPAESQLLLDFLKGNTAAAEFCASMLQAAHFIDDLIDRDKPIDDERIYANAWNVLVELPRNTFYRQHFDTLSPVVMIAMSDWMTATKFEREPGACLDKLATAFVARSSYLNVLVMAAIIVGGPEYGLKMAPWLREYFHREGYLQYRKNLRTESATREIANV